MWQHNLVLLAVFALGIAFKNSLIAASSGILLVMKFVRLQSGIRLLENRSLEAGLLLLLLAVLVPFANDRITLEEVRKTFTSLDGLLAVLGGIVAAYLCGRGVGLLQSRPQVIVGMVIGTILGVFLLKGVPIGPLAAAGFTAVFLQISRLFKK